MPFLKSRILCYYSAMRRRKKCVLCGTLLRGKQTKFCSRSCKNKDLQSYKKQQERGLARKLRLVREAGGKCTKCGYSKNLSALIFHHTDSRKKSFKLDIRSLSNRTLKSVLSEQRKCVLLCCNCHAELHNPELTLSRLLCR